jgi:Ca2+/Na+ antiporter
LGDKAVRLWFAIVLFATTSLFVLSAIYSLRALVVTRTWNWSEPFDLPRNPDDSRETQLGWRAAHLLEDFGANWEISLVKDRTVDLALLCLVAALVGIAVLAGLLVWYVATVNPPPISSP